MSENFQVVNTDTLTHFMMENNINTIDFLKVNAEGAEYDVMFNTPSNILERIKFMLVEMHPSEKEKELLKYLEDHGFAIEVINSFEEGTKKNVTARRL
jgi:hypothetical protein